MCRSTKGTAGNGRPPVCLAPIRLLTLIVAAGALCGCAMRSAGPSASPSRIQVTGEPGTPVHGYYLRAGRQFQVNEVVPFTIAERGLSFVELRKGEVEAELGFTVQQGGSEITGTWPAGMNGVQFSLENGVEARLLPK